MARRGGVIRIGTGPRPRTRAESASQQNNPIATVGVSPMQVTLVEMNQMPDTQVLLQQRPCHSMGCPDSCYTRNAHLLMLCTGGFFAVVGFVLGGMPGYLVIFIGMGMLAASLVCMCSKYGRITDMLRELEAEEAAMEASQAQHQESRRCLSCTTPLDATAGEVEVCHDCRAEGVLTMPMQLQDGRQTGVMFVPGAPPQLFDPSENYPTRGHPQGPPQMGSTHVPWYDLAHQHRYPPHQEIHHHCGGNGPWYDFSNAYNVPPPPPYEESPNAIEPKVSTPTTTPRNPRYPVLREDANMVEEAPPSPPTWPEHRADENVAEEYGVGGIYMDEEYGGMDMEEYAMPPEHELHELEEPEAQVVVNVLIQHENAARRAEVADLAEAENGSITEEASEESLPDFLATVQAQEAEFLGEAAHNRYQESPRPPNSDVRSSPRPPDL